MTHYTVFTAARALRLSVSRVRKLVVDRGLGQKCGSTWILSEEEVRSLAIRGPTGRPRKT